MTNLTEGWRDLEGQSLDNRYQLGKLLSAGENYAWFRAEVEGEPRMIYLSRADQEQITPELQHWTALQKIIHPNLVATHHVSTCDFLGVNVVYAITDSWDDDLAAVLQERPLTEAEVQQVTESLVPVLALLHEQSLVHGEIQPARIVATEQAIKLLCLGAYQTGEQKRISDDSAYDAPELASTGVTPAADMFSWGKTLLATLTQQTELSEADSVPEPFRATIHRCTTTAPESRATAQKLLHGASPESETEESFPAIPLEEVPMQVATEPEVLVEREVHRYNEEEQQRTAPKAIPDPPPAESSIRQRRDEEPVEPSKPIGKGLIAGILAAVIAVIGLFLWWPSQHTPAGKAPPASVVPVPAPAKSNDAPPAKATDAAPPSRPAQPSPAAETAAGGNWRVIAYTFNRQKDAQRRANDLNRKHSRFKAEVFSPSGTSSVYLVSLGGTMSREEAMRLKQRAISSGMPRDTYAQNFRP